MLNGNRQRAGGAVGWSDFGDQFVSGGSPNGIYGPRHYWLDELKADLSSHVGQTIQVTGTILDLEDSEVEREPGGWHGGTRVAIERPGRDVFTSPGNAGVNRADTRSREDMKITLLKLRVEKFMMVMKTCLPQIAR